MNRAVWSIDDPSHPVLWMMMERGIPSGHRFLVPPHRLEDVEASLAALLEAFPGAIKAHTQQAIEHITVLTDINHPRYCEDGTIGLTMIGPKDTMEPPPQGTNVAVHHVLSAAGGTPYSGVLKGWQAAIEATQDPPTTLGIDGAYWVTLADAAGALLRLGNELYNHDGIVNICGRRWWSAEDTWKELSMLSSRNSAGLYGTFTPEHLEGGLEVPVKVEDLSTAGHIAPHRPDLGPLHTLLETATGEGWNPTTPLRLGLMMVLADLATDRQP